jgi:uncharacterized protein YjbJ (UPF0337 family)
MTNDELAAIAGLRARGFFWRSYHDVSKHIKSLSFINIRRYQMNTSNMKGNWKETAGKLKQKFANLIDNDLLFNKGKKEELFGRLQQKIGKTKEQLRKLIGKI